MFEVPAADDPALMVEISVPVKGRRPLILRLPRYDMMDEPSYDGMWAALEAIDAADAAADSDKKLAPRKRNRLIALTTLKPFVSQKDYAVCETLTLGQLEAISEHWREQSGIPLGEYAASKNSSTGSTEAPSSTTSTPTVITAETSDAA